jgi:hypothetical protein
MIRSRSLRSGWFALVLLAAGAAPAFADVAGPWPWSKRPNRDRYITGPVKVITPDGEPTPPAPPDGQAPQPPADEKAAPAPNPQPMYPDDPVVRLPPRRSGPFRSCGSGTPVCLAGIGLAWGMLWLGNRFARTARSPSTRR